MSDDTFTLTAIQQRAKRCAERHGVELPGWSPADSSSTYVGRCANLFREFSPELNNTDLTRVGAFEVTSRLASQVFDAAEKARPHGAPDGGLRYITDRSSGREIIRAHADADDACWRQFTNVSLMVGKFVRPDVGALVAAQNRAKGWWQP